VSRVVLAHWNVEEAEARAEPLRRAGHRVEVVAEAGPPIQRRLRSDPPDVFVVSLDRIPSQGAALGVWLRRQKATRLVPLVFAAEDSARADKARRQLPDATFVAWSRLRGAVRKAAASPPRSPVVPGTMDAYSGTPLPRKLGVKAGTTIALLGAPRDFADTLGPLPDDVRLRRRAGSPVPLVLLFARSRSDLERRFPAAARTVAEGGSLWIAWPKRASGVVTDLGTAAVRAHGLAHGFVDYKICSIDATWSGLRFARRK
jgi:hypothetical protein